MITFPERRFVHGTLRSGLMCCCLVLCFGPTGAAGTLVGYVRDSNWYARYQGNPFGVGYYEFAVNACGGNDASTIFFGAAATDVFGRFQMLNLPTGTYQVASWDVWWRSAFAFNVTMPAAGSAPVVDLRLPATMWGYPAFWDDQGYFEFGQTFRATGPISMIYLRCPYNATYTLTVHTNGPRGAQVGVARTFTGGDQRPIYGYGDMPTVPGGRYYLRVRSSAVPGVLMQMDPRPDFSDPMPEGCLYLGDSTAVTPYPDRDLGVVILSDDDGLLTNLHSRQSGGSWSATRIGQSFIARGVGLISAAFWLADPTAPIYEVQLYDSPDRNVTIGPPRRGKPARLGADPEMLVIWPPGECPLTPGQTYYLEVRKAGAGAFNPAYVNTANPYPYGQAYRDGTVVASTDLAGTIMEEASPGSAARPIVHILSGPTVAESDRGTNELTVRWTTDVPADSMVEVAPLHPPYTRTVRQTNLLFHHTVTVPGLRAHTMHHFRVCSQAERRGPAVSRDLVICTRASSSNLLANPGFEYGTGPSPRKPVSGWSTSGGLDMAASDGTWFWGLEPHSGQWLFEGAVNGSTADGYLYQRVSVVPGKEYTFSAWVGTWMRENDTWKYDVWNDRNRLSSVRLGIDPQGGTSPAVARVQWTPRFYSHLRMSNVAKTAVSQAAFVTVFIEMKGSGGQWHLFGVDDCVLTESPATPPEITAIRAEPEAGIAMTVRSDIGVSTTLEVTENLADWATLTNWLNTSSETQVWDLGVPAHDRRFYRARIP